MKRKSMPGGLIPRHSTAVMTAEALAEEELLERHQLAAGCWGALHVLEGSVSFVELPGGEECQLNAPDVFVIAPQSPHKLRVDGPVTCRIDFFYPADAGPPKPEDFTPIDRQLVLESFRRSDAAGDFGGVFYDIFLNASPEIPPYFANTDFDDQKFLLRSTVYILVTRDTDNITARGTLERLGSTHSRKHLNVRPELYEVWLDSLCKTVEKLDPEWAPEIEEEWRRMLRSGIQIMTARF